ncbi:MAG TPA: hypothetical protein VGM56_10010 [Byssovorax sp.]|jgi:ElaB/YqjD/DUF883 family membrane-anchored ribosome-binding protein
MSTNTRSTNAANRKHKNGLSPRHASASHLGGVIDGAEALLAATADMGEERIVDVRDALKADLEAAREQLERIEGQLKGRVESVDDFVHENPWQAVGVAAAAGVLVGAMAFRR